MTRQLRRLPAFGVEGESQSLVKALYALSLINSASSKKPGMLTDLRVPTTR
jgi:hypothetical protein